MKKLLAFIIFSFSSWCFAGAFSAQAYHLVDDLTGQALVTLPSGESEAFLAGWGKLLFVGYFTYRRIEQDDPAPGRKFPEVDIGSRFKLRGLDQWVRVEKWCCDAYNWVVQQRDPSWSAYYSKLDHEAESFGAKKPKGPDQEGDLSSCSPFYFSATFILDPKTQQPRWSKYYAVARKGYDDSYRYCEREDWVVHASASVGSSLDATSVLVEAEDSKGYRSFFRVSVETGEILSPLPTDFKAIDASAVEQFKAEFLQRNQCPAFTAQELKNDHRYADTTTGRCLVERRKRYEESAMRHFFGEPQPQPELN